MLKTYVPKIILSTEQKTKIWLPIFYKERQTLNKIYNISEWGPNLDEDTNYMHVWKKNMPSMGRASVKL